MENSLKEQLGIYFQQSLPLLFSVFFLFLTYIPVNSNLLMSIRPAIPLICAYFWLMVRPDIFNLFSVFLLGVINDLASASPFGSNLLSLLILYTLVANLSKYFNAKPFAFIWLGFALTAFLTMFSQWLIVSVYYSKFLPVMPLLFSFLSSVAFYPVMSFINAGIRNLWIGEEE